VGYSLPLTGHVDDSTRKEELHEAQSSHYKSHVTSTVSPCLHRRFCFLHRYFYFTIYYMLISYIVWDIVWWIGTWRDLLMLYIGSAWSRNDAQKYDPKMGYSDRKRILTIRPWQRWRRSDSIHPSSWKYTDPIPPCWKDQSALGKVARVINSLLESHGGLPKHLVFNGLKRFA